jgi:hypothetical protein
MGFQKPRPNNARINNDCDGITGFAPPDYANAARTPASRAKIKTPIAVNFFPFSSLLVNGVGARFCSSLLVT